MLIVTNWRADEESARKANTQRQLSERQSVSELTVMLLTAGHIESSRTIGEGRRPAHGYRSGKAMAAEPE